MKTNDKVKMTTKAVSVAEGMGWAINGMALVGRIGNDQSQTKQQFAGKLYDWIFPEDYDRISKVDFGKEIMKGK